MDYLVMSLGAICIVALAIYLVRMVWKRRITHVVNQAVQEIKDATVPVCVICGRANPGEFLPLPDVAHERETWTYGKWTITVPRKITESEVKACAVCSSKAKIRARLLLEEMRVKEARDAQDRLRTLFEAQSDILTSDRDRKAAADKAAAEAAAARK